MPHFAQAEDVTAADQQDIDVTEVAGLTCEDMARAALTLRQALVCVETQRPAVLPGNKALPGVALRNLVENSLWRWCAASPSCMEVAFG